jgi:hypothetical protein
VNAIDPSNQDSEFAKWVGDLRNTDQKQSHGEMGFTENGLIWIQTCKEYKSYSTCPLNVIDQKNSDVVMVAKLEFYGL